MTFHYLESADDPRVTDYTTLTDVHLRKLREPEEGMYIAESSRVLRRALAAGHQPRSFFLAEKWLEDLDDVFQAYPDVPVFIGWRKGPCWTNLWSSGMQGRIPQRGRGP